MLIYKTYEDARTYQLHREANPRYDIRPGDITWVRSLSGYRLGVVRWREENRQLKMERDILKKATAFFAKENS